MPPKSDIPNSSLLSAAAYDDDASLRSPSEQDSDSEDDEYLSKSRTTQELAQHDRSVLEDEDEREKLLMRTVPTSGLRRIFSPNTSSVRIGRRERRRRRRRKEGGRGRRPREQAGEGDELMFEMEEGYRDDSSSLLSTPASDSEDIGVMKKEGYASAQVGCQRLLFVLMANIYSRNVFRGGRSCWLSLRCWCSFLSSC